MSQNERQPRHWAVSLGGIVFASAMFLYGGWRALQAGRPDLKVDHGIVACTFLVFVALYAIHFRYRNDREAYQRIFGKRSRSVEASDRARLALVRRQNT